MRLFAQLGKKVSDKYKLKDGSSVSHSKLQRSLKNYDNVPSSNLQARMAYFYGPYNDIYEVNRHMDFEEPLQEERWTKLVMDLLKMQPKQFKMFRQSIEIYHYSPRKDVIAKINEKEWMSIKKRPEPKNNSHQLDLQACSFSDQAKKSSNLIKPFTQKIITELSENTSELS
jgi:hypothetical protein